MQPITYNYRKIQCIYEHKYSSVHTSMPSKTSIDSILYKKIPPNKIIVIRRQGTVMWRLPHIITSICFTGDISWYKTCRGLYRTCMNRLDSIVSTDFVFFQNLLVGSHSVTNACFPYSAVSDDCSRYIVPDTDTAKLWGPQLVDFMIGTVRSVYSICYRENSELKGFA